MSVVVVRRVVDDGVVVDVVGGVGGVVREDPVVDVLPLEPGVFDLAVYRGDTYEWVFQLTGLDPVSGGAGLPVDVTGWRFKAEIRSAVDGVLLAGLQRVLPADPGGPVVGDDGFGDWVERELVDGLVRLRLTADQSRRVDRAGVWDLEVVTPEGWVKTVLRGRVLYMGDVTTGVVGYG